MFIYIWPRPINTRNILIGLDMTDMRAEVEYTESNK